MTEQAKPCNSSRCDGVNHWLGDQAFVCPVNAPKASDAPKRCPECKHRPHGTVCFNGESDGDCGCEYGKPAPAPEAPKVENCAYCHHSKKLHYAKGCGVCMDLTFPRCREYKPAPQAEDGGKVEEIWDNTTICFGNDCPNCERERKRKNKPAPAPEPKRGSEVDMWDEYATGDGRVWVLKTAYLALRAEVEELKAGLPAREDVVITLTVRAERAERALGDAEERVKELENLLVRMQTAEGWTSGPWKEASEAARTILAKRKEESK